MQPENRENTKLGGSAPNWILLASAAVAVLGLSFGLHGRWQARQAAAIQESQVAKLRQQVESLASQLEAKEALLTQRPAPARSTRVAEVQSGSSKPSPLGARERTQPGVREPVTRPAASNARLEELANRVSAQDQKIEGALQRTEETRAEFEGKLSSAKEELDGSIARTREEVAALRKLGMREYFEFQMPKSKQVVAVGPISMALRKADTKRKRYDMDLVVDDVKLQKKGVNQFEPLYFRMSDRPQPLEVVVNGIEKDRVRGYVSVAKYKESELRSEAVARPKLPVQ